VSETPPKGLVPFVYERRCSGNPSPPGAQMQHPIMLNAVFSAGTTS
jgi:hypothetical protein